MKLTCPVTGLEWKASYMRAAASHCHPFLATPLIKIPAQISLLQQGELTDEEVHLLFCNLLLNTEHVIFSSPLILTPELSQVENAQISRLTNLVMTGVFHKENIDLPAFHITADNQDISQLLSIWETELDSYRISYLIAKQEHEARAMLSRVQKAFATPLLKNRKQIITKWMLKVVTLPDFLTLHPTQKAMVPICDYWIELLHKAIDGDAMLPYPEKDIVEFKSHLEEHLPFNYAQEFSLLEELQMAITRKQNYFGYSFVDSDERSYAIDTVKPSLKREDFPSVTAYLNAIKMSRNSH